MRDASTSELCSLSSDTVQPRSMQALPGHQLDHRLQGVAGPSPPLSPSAPPSTTATTTTPSIHIRVYTDKAGVAHDRHPVHAYYTGAMFMDEGGYAQLKAIAAARPPCANEVRSAETGVCVRVTMRDGVRSHNPYECVQV